MAASSCGERECRLEKHVVAKLVEGMSSLMTCANLHEVRANAGSADDILIV
jgi:hypothetical protein